MVDNYNKGVNRTLKQQRVSLSLTLRELAERSGVSTSHLGRIERGERFPSAHILRKIAKPLGFNENELFILAGFLSLQSPVTARKDPHYSDRHLHPYVANVLAKEPVEIQRSVIGILTILKSIAKNMGRENLQQ